MLMYFCFFLEIPKLQFTTLLGIFYRIKVTVRGTVDSTGMVMDASILKKYIFVS